MRTFFANCGALALMIPIGLLQSENTNAEDGFRRGNRRTIQTFARVQRYNDCSSRPVRPGSLSRCGVDNCGVAGCGTRLSTTRGCRSGNLRARRLLRLPGVSPGLLRLVRANPSAARHDAWSAARSSD